MQDKKIRIVIGFIIGVLIGVGGYWMFNKEDAPKNEVAQQKTEEGVIIDNSTIASSTISETDSTGSIVGADPAINVEDQNPGRVVIVTQSSLPNIGWVVIHDNNNGQPGNVLGARLFGKGKNSGLIELQRPMEVGKSYIAVLHTDDGNQKVFDPKKDLPIKNAKGELVMIKFNVSKATD